MAIFNSFLYVYQRVSVVLQSYLSIVGGSSHLLSGMNHQVVLSSCVPFQVNYEAAAMNGHR